MGLVAAIILGGGSTAKSILMVLLGVLFGLVGIDVKIARFLVKAPAAVKLMFKAVTQHPLTLFKTAPFIPGVITAIGIFRAQVSKRQRVGW